MLIEGKVEDYLLPHLWGDRLAVFYDNVSRDLRIAISTGAVQFLVVPVYSNVGVEFSPFGSKNLPRLTSFAAPSSLLAMPFMFGDCRELIGVCINPNASDKAALYEPRWGTQPHKEDTPLSVTANATVMARDWPAGTMDDDRVIEVFAGDGSLREALRKVCTAFPALSWRAACFGIDTWWSTCEGDLPTP